MAMAKDDIGGAGAATVHGIWFAVVNDRVFARPWIVKPRGWYWTFLEELHGTVRIADHEIAVCVVRTQDKRVKAAVDRAHLDNYNILGAIKYA
jgi:hypothetical protein